MREDGDRTRLSDGAAAILEEILKEHANYSVNADFLKHMKRLSSVSVMLTFRVITLPVALLRVDAGQCDLPASAERVLLLIYPPEKAEEVMGDMAETFLRVAQRHGPGYARWWYRWQVFRAGFSRLLSLWERVAKQAK